MAYALVNAREATRDMTAERARCAVVSGSPDAFVPEPRRPLPGKVQLQCDRRDDRFVDARRVLASLEASHARAKAQRLAKMSPGARRDRRRVRRTASNAADARASDEGVDRRVEVREEASETSSRLFALEFDSRRASREGAHMPEFDAALTLLGQARTLSSARCLSVSSVDEFDDDVEQG